MDSYNHAHSSDPATHGNHHHHAHTDESEVYGLQQANRTHASEPGTHGEHHDSHSLESDAHEHHHHAHSAGSRTHRHHHHAHTDESEVYGLQQVDHHAHSAGSRTHRHHHHTHTEASEVYGLQQADRHTHASEPATHVEQHNLLSSESTTHGQHDHSLSSEPGTNGEYHDSHSSEPGTHAEQHSSLPLESGTNGEHHHTSSSAAHDGQRHRYRRKRRSYVSDTVVYGVYDKEHHHHHRRGLFGRRHRHHHSRGNSKRLLASIAIVLLGIILIPLTLALGWTLSLNRTMSMGGESEAIKAQLVSQTQVQAEAGNSGFYVMLVGSDAREGEAAGRGDVFMLGRVDPDARTVTLVSIPRDTMIHIAGIEGPQKINATYACGGASTAVYAISHFAGVSISHYAEVDFAGIEHVVDRLGGVWVDVPETVETSVGTIEAGHQRLNSAQALAYARERYTATGGDFGRARAQRLVAEAIIRQVLESDPLEVPGLVSDLAGCVSTDYSVSALVGLARQMMGGELTLYSAVCPSYAFWQDGVAYAGTMYDEWQDVMRRVDAGLDPNGDDEIPEPQRSDERLGMAENALSPRDYQDLAAQNMTTDVVEELAPQTVVTDELPDA